MKNPLGRVIQVIFRQYLHFNPVAASYLFGCGGQGKGVVVDPLESEIDFYVEQANAAGMKITHVFDTHLHADHISGGRKLAAKTGAKYVLHRSAETNFSFMGVDDGDEIIAGNVVIRVLHTPGHTPEHISLLVTDKSRGEKPWFVLTGHTLMVGDVGRTELASDIEKGATDLFDSLGKFLSMDDYIEVYPGAFSGSVCGRALSGKPASSIGFERQFNKGLQIRDETDFVTFMTKDVPPKPENFDEIRRTNMGYEK